MSKRFADLKQASHDSKARQQYVTDLFNDLAPRYDRFNRWVSFSRDESWRRHTIGSLGARAKGAVLDLAAGTGDLANAAKDAGAREVHVFDISHEMLKLAKVKLLPEGGNGSVWFSRGSAHRLPFADASMDGVVSGFAMRNVFHFLDEVLAEIYRVLKPGGRFAILELSQPGNPLLKAGFKIHMRTIMPLIGRITTGNPAPFGYLCQTTMTFLSPEQFRARLLNAGFVDVGWRSFLFGSIAIHSGMKE